MVLGRPEIPLHTNGSENDIRCQVARRKITGGTRSVAGRDCRDAFAASARPAPTSASASGMTRRQARRSGPPRNPPPAGHHPAPLRFQMIATAFTPLTAFGTGRSEA
jgi:hypothetical protein